MLAILCNSDGVLQTRECQFNRVPLGLNVAVALKRDRAIREGRSCASSHSVWHLGLASNRDDGLSGSTG
jgi:hypothetical protein